MHDEFKTKKSILFILPFYCSFGDYVSPIIDCERGMGYYAKGHIFHII
jgi:hypothetical protein